MRESVSLVALLVVPLVRESVSLVVLVVVPLVREDVWLLCFEVGKQMPSLPFSLLGGKTWASQLLDWTRRLQQGSPTG